MHRSAGQGVLLVLAAIIIPVAVGLLVNAL